MFERLERLPTDPILGLMTAFRADTDPRKVDVGVGVYRDDRGETPVLQAVRRAEQAVLARQTTKAYVGASGNLGFNEAMERLILGPQHPVLAAGRVRSIQAPGGCGALRLGAELIRVASPDAIVHVSNPTWANHVPLLTGSGLKLERYPYYDPAQGKLQFESMAAALDQLPARSVVLLHASCHNPTGADLSEAQWRQVLEIVRRRSLIPFIDLAYQGLGTGVDADAYGIRLFAAELPEVLVAVSCSKNFGLYRERTGVLHVVNDSTAAADATLSQLVRIARSLYSMPPDHGAAIVHEILTQPALKDQWIAEVGSMRQRMSGLRSELVARLATACPQHGFAFISAQQGMFSLLGLPKEQVRELREEHHVFMTDDSRINVAGLRADNLEYFARAIAAVVRG
ncbi:MAG TPA: amino acid aminotransferase [Steroidobacteraceae bacterium]|nr:amino acid aminotransferase [Steroidobacteraceae bacterium]